jgi:hypothetical protein
VAVVEAVPFEDVDPLPCTGFCRGGGRGTALVVGCWASLGGGGGGGGGGGIPAMVTEDKFFDQVLTYAYDIEADRGR